MDIHDRYNSKIKFRHQAFVATYPYPIQFQYSSSCCLNTDTEDADTTASGKEFHILITLCVTKFSFNCSLECFLYNFV